MRNAQACDLGVRDMCVARGGGLELRLEPYLLVTDAATQCQDSRNHWDPTAGLSCPMPGYVATFVTNS